MADRALTVERLTPREREIVRLVADGWNNRRIAERFAISPATVATHLHSIHVKLEIVGGRVALVLYAQAHGIAPCGCQRR